MKKIPQTKLKNLLNKINTFDYKKYDVQINQIGKKFILDIIYWLNNGGDFDDPQNPDATVGGILTNDDVANIKLYKHDPNHTSNMNQTIERLIKKYGTIINIPLYRGCSNAEYENITHAVEKHKQLFITTCKSFTSLKDKAEKFAIYGGGSIVDMYSRKPGNVIKLITNNKPIIDYDLIYSCEELGHYFYFKYVNTNILTDDDLQNYFLDQLNSAEFEYIIPKKYQFKCININPYEFSI